MFSPSKKLAKSPNLDGQSKNADHEVAWFFAKEILIIRKAHLF